MSEKDYFGLEHDTAFRYVRHAISCDLTGLASEAKDAGMTDISAAMMQHLLICIAASGLPKPGDKSGGWRHGEISGPREANMGKSTYYANIKPLLAAGLLKKDEKGRGNAPTLYIDPDVLYDLALFTAQGRKASSELDDVELGSLSAFITPVQPPAEPPAAGVNGGNHGGNNGGSHGANHGANDGSNHGSTDGASHGTSHGANQGSNEDVVLEVRSVPLTDCSEPHPWTTEDGGPYNCQECC